MGSNAFYDQTGQIRTYAPDQDKNLYTEIVPIEEQVDATVAIAKGAVIWEVYAGGELLHTTIADESARRVISPKLSLEIGEPGSFSFQILPTHPLYDKLSVMKTKIRVVNEGEEIFRGRVIQIQTDIDQKRSISCEGDLAYLLDAVIQLKTDKSITARKHITNIINGYNNAVDASRKFTLGTVTANLNDKEIEIDDETWMDCRAALDKFVDTFGGYLRTRKSGNTVYLDYLADSSYVLDRNATDGQTLTYGGTILNLTKTVGGDDLFTVLIPEGDTITENESSRKAKDKTVNLTALGTSTATYSVKTNKDTTITHANKSRELVWSEGVSQYGRIMRAESFSGVTKDTTLRSRANRYFYEMVKSLQGNITVTAVDMHLQNGSIRPIRIGQQVRIVSEPHNLDETLTCMKMDLSLEAPEQAQYTFDMPYRMLNGNSFAKKTKKQQQKQEQETQSTKRSGARTAAKASANAAGVEENTKDIASFQKKLDELDKKIDKVKDSIPDYDSDLPEDVFSISITGVYSTTIKDGDGNSVKVLTGEVNAEPKAVGRPKKKVVYVQ